MLADSSKFGKRNMCRVCDWQKIHMLITDSNANDHALSAFLRKNVVFVTTWIGFTLKYINLAPEVIQIN